MAKTPVAIVGAETLLGREIKERLEELPVSVRSIGAEPALTLLVGRDEEERDTLVSPLDEDNFTGARVAFLAGAAASSRKAAGLARRLASPPVLIDVAGTLEESPRARLRAPALEPAGIALPAGAVHVIPHPAALVLAEFLARLDRICRLESCVAHVFEPASERGQRGIDELQRQTVNLLSFKTIPKEVFDAQVAFSLLAGFGENAPESLASIETRLERNLASLLAMSGRGPMPSLRLIQAPVFHGHSFSVWARFAERPEIGRLAGLLEAAGMDVRAGGLEPPNNVGMANQSGFAAGAIEADRNDSRAAWFWLAADNFRVAADCAVEVARRLLAEAAP